MVRTQIQLTEQQNRQLKTLAHRKGISMAEVIRRAIDRAFAPQMDETHRQARCAQWQRAVQRTRRWLAES